MVFGLMQCLHNEFCWDFTLVNGLLFAHKLTFTSLVSSVACFSCSAINEDISW